MNPPRQYFSYQTTSMVPRERIAFATNEPKNRICVTVNYE